MDLIRSVWEEARDLVKRLEGSTVRGFSVQAGETKIEIERGPPAGVAVGAAPRPPAGPAAAGARGRGGTRPELDGRHPGRRAAGRHLLPRAAQPGAKPFVEEGDVVDEGQTVAIVEAMKLMNQVKADQARAGRRRSSATTATGSSSSSR